MRDYRFWPLFWDQLNFCMRFQIPWFMVFDRFSRVQTKYYLPLFFSHRLIKVNFLRTGNQQTSIYKKGNRTDPANYRSISLTSICSKILEHIIYSFISTHLSNYNILSSNQHGFRTGQSCGTQLLGAINNFHHGLDTGSHIDTLFLDFTKAFDKVSHRKLCHKLSCYRVNGNLLCWIKDYLTNRSQCVLLEGISSKSHHVLSGVPQGLVLGPLLFLIYINDITESITSTIRFYADNVLIYRVISNKADTICLQNNLSILENWANTWQMRFNPSKCIHLAITRKRPI